MMTKIIQTPVITVIVAVLNGEKTLQRCIDNIVGQSYPNKELIIMDGGSTDSTVEIIKHNNDKITYWESKPDRGISHAWNKAMDHTHGEWIYFLGADDYFWKPDVLKSVEPYLAGAFPRYRVVYGQVALVENQGKTPLFFGEPWEKISKRFLLENTIPHQGVFHHCVSGDLKIP